MDKLRALDERYRTDSGHDFTKVHWNELGEITEAQAQFIVQVLNDVSRKRDREVPAALVESRFQRRPLQSPPRAMLKIVTGAQPSLTEAQRQHLERVYFAHLGERSRAQAMWQAATTADIGARTFGGDADLSPLPDDSDLLPASYRAAFTAVQEIDERYRAALIRFATSEGLFDDEPR